MRVLITGGTGLLGSTLAPYIIDKGLEVIIHGVHKSSVSNITGDLVDSSKCMAVLDNVKPDVIINLVALTNVDLCENNQQLAYELNVRVVENITNWMRGYENTKLIQISTDHVYDGNGEQDENKITIRNVYAFSKYCGELVALRSKSIILRTNFFGKSIHDSRKSFTDWLYDSLLEKKNITLFKDVYFSPLSMVTLSKTIFKILFSTKTGIYNLGSNMGMSKRDFSHIFVESCGLQNKTMKDGVTGDSLDVVRPKGMVMNNKLFEKDFDIKLPLLTEEIEEECQRYIIK